MVIQIKNVYKRFKDISILENVSIDFKEGKIYGIIGPNGSGKSVLLKMICGFYEPTSGEILFDGKNVIKEKGFPPDTRAMIEKPTFLSDVSGMNNLKLLASIQNKIDDTDIEKTMNLVGLDPSDKKHYSKYSLGMKQKLNIAQVLMENPKIMILDEPFNALDQESAERIRKVFIEEKKKKKIIIIATNIQEDIKLLCDEVYKIENHRVKKV